MDGNEIINQTPPPIQKAKNTLLPVLSKLNADKINPKHLKLILIGSLVFVFILVLIALVMAARPKEDDQNQLPQAPEITQVASPSPIISPQAQKVTDFGQKLEETSFQSKLTEPIVDLDLNFQK